MSIFINISNHSSSGWSESQKAEAIRLVADDERGDTPRIIDIQFPAIPPEFSAKQVCDLAGAFAVKVFVLLRKQGEIAGLSNLVSMSIPPVIHVMGEQSFCYYFSREIAEMVHGIKTVVSTSSRIVEEKDGVKTSVFNFCRFREISSRTTFTPCQKSAEIADKYFEGIV